MERSWTYWAPVHDDWHRGAVTSAGVALRRAVADLLQDSVDPPDEPSGVLEEWRRVTKPLPALKALRWLERSMELERAFLIAQARVEGASWSQIGRTLDLTKQAAQQRYGDIAEKIAHFCTAESIAGEDLVDMLDRHFTGKQHFWTAPEDL
jgi:hypothetical protein